MEHLTQKIYSEKIKVFITIEPFNIRLAALFNANESITTIKIFIQNKMKQIDIKYVLGRLELKEKLAILLPEYHIGDFLENNSEVIAYSQDYGLNMRTLPGDGMDQRPFYQKVFLLYEDKSFLKKKTNRNNNNKNNKKVEINKKPKIEQSKKKEESTKEEKKDNKTEKKDKKESDNKDKTKKEVPKTQKKEKNEKSDDTLAELRQKQEKIRAEKSEKKDKKEYTKYVVTSDDDDN